MRLIPQEPSEEVLRQILATEYPATFRKELRSACNGPETAHWTEKQIVRAYKIYAAIYNSGESNENS